jgi:hypothetical protein
MGNPNAYVAKTNSVGRYAGSGSGDNFFTKKAKSIENALGTTAAAAIGGINEAIVNNNRDNMMKDNQTRMNEVAKKYGYNTYHDVWDARDKAEAEGDQATLDFINNTINPELQGQATANKNKIDKFASNYKDYVQNDYIGQKTNQDQGKFLGSAINTMSTATDVLGLTNGPLSNAIQGGIEGVADELEQNGLKDFSWERAGQNALTGAASGAVTGALNAKINGALAKRGGNLLKGGNKLTQAINSFNATNPVGQLASSLGTGAARGAISGAVGGATGAGLSAAMNNQDVLGSALQGAKQGAISGAGTGAVMAGANSVINRTPFMQKVNQAQQDWQNSGDSFKERFDNTRTENDTWGNRFINNRIEDINAVKNGFKDVGEGLGVLAGRGADAVSGAVDNLRTSIVNRNAVNRLADAIENGTNGDIRFARISQDLMDDINSTRVAQGFEPLTDRQVKAYMNTVNNHLSKRTSEGMDANEVAQIAFNALTSSDATAGAMDLNKGESNLVFAKDEQGRYNQAAVGRADSDGGTSLKTIIPNATDSQIKRILQNKEDILNSRAGVANPASLSEEPSARATISGRQATDSIISQNDQNVNASWDRLAQESGFNNYDDAVRQFKQANPDVEATAANVTDFMDTSVNANKKTFTQAKSSKTIKNERAIQEEILDQFNAVGQPTVRATKPRETFYNLYNDKGLSDENQIRQAVHYAEPGELVPTMIREAAGRAGVVDLTDAQSLVQDLKLNKRQNYTKTLNVVEDIIDSTPSTISGGKNGVDALQLQRALEQAASDALGSNGTYHIGSNLVDATTAQNLYRVASSIGENLDKAVAENNGVAYVQNKYANEIQEMRNSQPGNTKWQKFVDDDIAGATSIKQLRGAIKDLTRASIYIEDGDNRYGTIGGTAARKNNSIPTSKAGMANRLVNDIYEKATSSPQARSARLARAERNIAMENNSGEQAGKTRIGEKASTWLHDKLVGKTNNESAPTATLEETIAPTTTSTEVNNPSMNIYNAIGRNEGRDNAQQARTADYLVNAAQEAEVVNDNTGIDATMNPQSTSLYNTLYGQTSNSTNSGANGTIPTFNSIEEERAVYFFPPTGDYWSDMLSRAMRRAKNAEDYSAMEQLYSMYQDQLSNLSKSQEKDYSNPVNWNSADRKSLLQAQNGLDQIDELEASYNDAVGSGGGNLFQGTLRQWSNNISGGNLDPSADEYVKQANSLGAGIIKNLVNLGSTEYDAQRYIDYLPKLTDTKEQASRKLQKLKNAYQNVIENLQGIYNA